MRLLFLLLPAALTLAFDPSSDSNVVVYWGQGPNQPRLEQFCADPAIDIINIAFVDIFPDQGTGGFPGTNFGNACDGSTYITKDGVQTELLKDCPKIGRDITTCQKEYGKKVLLSIGGALPGNGYIESDESAVSFADFLWGAFGPATDSWAASHQPRPFGDAVVDGFDFDIESTAVTPEQEDFGWATLINHLKTNLFHQDESKSYYISGAPQCVLPDAHLSNAIANSWFDFILVQFFNTPSCSARAGIAALNGGAQSSGSDISLTEWFAATSLNPNSKIFIGLPASTSAAGNLDYYLQPEEVGQLVAAYRPKNAERFGGIMLWDATWSYDNPINGKPYVDAIKAVLEDGSSSGGGNALNPAPPAATVTKSKHSSPTRRPHRHSKSPSAPTATAIALVSPTPTPSSSPVSGPTTCDAPSVSCDNPGAVVCVGTSQFGLCDINYCAVPQQLAAGTSCKDGVISKRSAYTRRSRRNVSAFHHEKRAAMRWSGGEETNDITGREPEPLADPSMLSDFDYYDRVAKRRSLDLGSSVPTPDSVSAPDDSLRRRARSYDSKRYRRHHRRALHT